MAITTKKYKDYAYELDASNDWEDDAKTVLVTEEDGNRVANSITGGNAKNNPSGYLYVNGTYTAKQAPFYETTAQAITGARALIQGGLSKVVIKAFLDSDGNPQGLPEDESIYDLADEGIYFVSDFDPWAWYLKHGGLLKQSELLYNIKQSELSHNIRG